MSFALSSIPGFLSKTATINTSGDNEAVVAVAGKYICVYRYKLRTASTSVVTVAAKDDAGGTIVDTDLLQAPTSGVFGSNESVTPPGYLFRTIKGGALNINLSGNISVTYTLSYFLSEVP